MLDLVQLDNHWWWKTSGRSQIQKTDGRFPRHQNHITQSERLSTFKLKQLEHMHNPNDNEGSNDQTGQISILSKELYIPTSIAALTLQIKITSPIQESFHCYVMNIS